MRTCSKCGGTEPECTFNAGSGTYCRRCKSENKRKRRAAKKRTSEHQYGVAEVPEGFRIKGITQLLGPDGKIKNQHVKTELEPVAKGDKSAVMLEALRQMCEPYKGSVDPVPAPADPAEDLLLHIPIGDAHVGMVSHAEETGEEFNLQIQEPRHMAAVDALLSVAPQAGNALISNVGDYLHSDNPGGRSATTKGTPLDQDGPRFAVLLVALRMFRRTIDATLLKAKTVTVICATGNHDGESSTWLRLCLALVYEREPRVVIRTEPTKFHYYQHGRCLFGITHGDSAEKDLPMIMACDQPALWAATDHRIWVKGHLHHSIKTTHGGEKEKHGCIVRTYRTLAGTDAWHHGQGYRSGKDLRLEVWHKERGQTNEFIHGVAI